MGIELLGGSNVERNCIYTDPGDSPFVEQKLRNTLDVWRESQRIARRGLIADAVVGDGL